MTTIAVGYSGGKTEHEETLCTPFASPYKRNYFFAPLFLPLHGPPKPLSSY